MRANEAEVRKVKEILTSYESVSGQLVNYKKTTVSFSKCTPEGRRNQIANWLGVPAVEEHDKYLGLPTVVGHSKEVVARVIRDKLCRKLQGWKGMLLSKAGREVLIKAVAQSIPTYAMSVFRLPINFYDELRALVSRFWWGSDGGKKKIPWIAWSQLCRPKCLGGLGFRNYHEFNLALLGKQAWRMITDQDCLMVRVLGGKYFPNRSFMKAELGSNPSYTWRGILEAREVLMKGLRRRIGNGLSTKVWQDP
ncbi:putative mitochondrial protein AtMg00310 [Silene latifolia]|uniref:putative mitochondrial protein AtMg00310 n=1 Tax=Silene latifolia TaxID=37657 RepID=UPI003D786D50